MNQGMEKMNVGNDPQGAIDVFLAMKKKAREMKFNKKVWEGSALGNLGIAYMSVGQNNEAMKNLNGALEIACEIGDRGGQGRCLGNIGNVYLSLGQYRKSIKKHDAALKISREIGDRSGEGTDLSNIGIICNILGKFRNGISYLTEAFEIALEIEDGRLMQRCLRNIGRAHNSLGQHDEAIEKFTAAVELSSEVDDRPDEEFAFGRGDLMSGLRENDKSIKNLTAAVEIARNVGGERGEESCLYNLGSEYFSLGQYHEAVENLTEALDISRRIGNRQREGHSLRMIGVAYNYLGKLNEAIEALNVALEIAREINNADGEIECLACLGNTYMGLGEHDKAIQNHSVALNISHKTKDKKKMGRFLCNLGEEYFKLGKYNEAIRNYNSALDIACEMNNRWGEALCRGNLGICYYYNNQDKSNERNTNCQAENVIRSLEKALKIFYALWHVLSDDLRRIIFQECNYSRVLQSQYYDMNRHQDALVTCNKDRSKTLELLMMHQQSCSEPITRTLTAEFDEIISSNESKEDVAFTNFKMMKETAIMSKSAILVYSFHVDGRILIWFISSNDEYDLIHEDILISDDLKSLEHIVEVTRRVIGSKKLISTDEGDIEDIDSYRFDDDELQMVATRLAKLDEKGEKENYICKVRALIDESKNECQMDKDEEERNIAERILRRVYDLFVLPIEYALKAEERVTIVPFGELFVLPFAVLLDHNYDEMANILELKFAPSIGSIVERQSCDTKKISSSARTEVERESTGGQRKTTFEDRTMEAMNSSDLCQLHESRDDTSASGAIREEKVASRDIQNLHLLRSKFYF